MFRAVYLYKALPHLCKQPIDNVATPSVCLYKLSLTTVCGLCVKHFSSGYVFKGNRGIGIPYRQIQIGRLNTQWVTDKRNSDNFSMVSGSWRFWHPRQGNVVYGMLELLLIYQIVHVSQKPLFRRSNSPEDSPGRIMTGGIFRHRIMTLQRVSLFPKE